MTEANEKTKRKDQRRAPRRLTIIDIDALGVHVVHAERNGSGPKIFKAADKRFPEGLDAADPQALGKFLAVAMDEFKLAGSTAVFCLPRAKVTLKPLSLPPDGTSDEIASMVELQMQDDLPFGPAQTVIDHIELGAGQSPPAHPTDEAKNQAAEKTNREKSSSPISSVQSGGSAGPQETAAKPQRAGIDVLVAATNKDTVGFYSTVAQTAGLQFWSLGLRPVFDAFAMSCCLTAKGYDSAVMLHIMPDETEISVVERGKLRFSRSAVLKLPMGSANEDQVVNQLMLETVRTIQAFQAQSPQSNPGIILTAGGANLEQRLRQALAKKLGVRCEPFEPHVSGLLAGAEQLPRITAIGGSIAWLGGNSALISGPRSDLFDFLSPKRPPVIKDRRKERALAIAAAIILAFIGSILAGNMYLSAKQDKLAELQNTYDKLAKTKKSVDVLKKSLADIENWNAAQRDWLAHIANLSGLFPSCEMMYINNLRTEGDNQISFLILSRSGDAITEFGRKLAAFGYEFKPGAITTAKDDLGYTYRSQCKVTIPASMKLELASIRWEPRPADDLKAGETQRPTAGPAFNQSGTGSQGGAPVSYKPSNTPPAAATQKPSVDKPKEDPSKQNPQNNFRTYRRTRQ